MIYSVSEYMKDDCVYQNQWLVLDIISNWWCICVCRSRHGGGRRGARSSAKRQCRHPEEGDTVVFLPQRWPTTPWGWWEQGEEDWRHQLVGCWILEGRSGHAVWADFGEWKEPSSVACLVQGLGKVIVQVRYWRGRCLIGAHMVM